MEDFKEGYLIVWANYERFPFVWKKREEFSGKRKGQFSSVKMKRDERVPFTPSYSVRDWVLTIRHFMGDLH